MEFMSTAGIAIRGLRRAPAPGRGAMRRHDLAKPGRGQFCAGILRAQAGSRAMRRPRRGRCREAPEDAALPDPVVRPKFSM